MRRLSQIYSLLLFSGIVLALIAWVVYPKTALATTPRPEIPTADILRESYPPAAEVVVPTADVLRAPYGMRVSGVAVVPRADVLRGPYEVVAPMVAAVPRADVLRGAYDGPSAAPVAVPLADVLRGAYDGPSAAPVAVPLADVLRGPVMVPAPVLLRGEQLLADVLRGPYEFALPVAVATARTTVLAWLLAGIALALLLMVLAMDLSRRAHGMGRMPRGGGRPLEHPH